MKLMKKSILILSTLLLSLASTATIHVVNVWDGYFQFLPSDVTIQLGDTLQWLPLDDPMMVHTITSTDIPDGAMPFDQIWQAPADTFFQYVPLLPGLYEYECSPHAISYGMIGSFTVLDGPTHLNDQSAAESSLKLYPNPSSDIIYMDGLDASTAYRVYDAEGKLLFTGRTTGTIDISALSEGPYLLELVGDRPRFKSFVILR
jgi:plastocyanin